MVHPKLISVSYNLKSVQICLLSGSKREGHLNLLLFPNILLFPRQHSIFKYHCNALTQNVTLSLFRRHLPTINRSLRRGKPYVGLNLDFE